MRKVAKKVNLVDRPNSRKLHSGAIPLVGGISICFSILYFLFNNSGIIENTELYAICIFILTLIGAIDDKYDISYKVRFVIQAAISIAMMSLGGIELKTIGDIFGTGDVITLGWLGYFVTILAVIAAINAFNMVDGIDGLLGGLSIITFSSLSIMLAYDGQYNIAYLCLIMIVVTAPYILLNLGFFGRKRKVFMGDAGSMLIGFTVIWVLLLSSQNGTTPPIKPVTALWLIAIPLMDMATIMIRRVLRGDSPFKPDREHLHHIFQRLGLSSLQTLVSISTIATIFSFVGIYSQMTKVPEYIMFYAFIVCFAGYFFIFNHLSKQKTGKQT